MKQNLIQKLVLYRYRYIIGYSLFAAILLLLLTLELGRVPAGITNAEMDSTIVSASLTATVQGLTSNIVDLPYHLLQKTSTALLGVNDLSIKLPSVLVALASGAGLLLLLLRWFKPNVAIISGLIAITMSMFLVTGRTGTAMIMIVFWSIYLLLVATLITQESKMQFGLRLGLGVLIGLSLYTPLTVYILGAALIAGLLHPHSRYTLRRFGGPETAGMLALLALTITPLVYGLWQNPTAALQLAGVPDSVPSAGEYATQLGSVITKLAGFWAPNIGEVIQPAFSLASLLLIMLGLLRSVADYHATRTYALLIWTAVLIPVVALQPDYIVVLYVPAILFMAIGIQTLVKEWYSLFPRNPYARIAGLLPLIALIGGLWHYNFTTYFNGYRYSPEIAEVYSSDLRLITDRTDQLKSSDEAATLVVTPHDKAFFQLLERDFPNNNLRVIDTGQPLPNTKTLFVSGAANTPAAAAYRLGQPSTFLVNDYQNDSARWYVYNR